MAKKAAASNGAKAQQARVNRANAAIEKIMREENVVLTANRVRVLFANAEGKYGGGDTIGVKALAALLDRPNMLIMPLVQIEASNQPQPEPK